MQNEEKLKKLGDAELEIMMALWERTEPATSGEILESIKESRSWALSTLMASLQRLADKGYVNCDRSTRTNYYTAIISAEQYKSAESRSFISRLYGNSVSRLVAGLYNSNSITESDIDELRAFLDSIERGEQDD